MQSLNSVYVQRNYNCSIQELFKWLTDPTLITQWFGPAHLQVGHVATDPKKGGSYNIELINTNGASFTIEGKYLEIVEYTCISFSLVYRGLNNPPPESIVKRTLAETTKNSSNLSFVQKFEMTPPNMERRSEAWEHMFKLLSKIILQH